MTLRWQEGLFDLWSRGVQVEGTFRNHEARITNLESGGGGGGGGTTGLTSFMGRTTPAAVLQSADVTTALGFIPAPQYSLPAASTTVLGGVKVDGTSVTIDSSNVIHAPGTGFQSAVTWGTSSVNTGSGTIFLGTAPLVLTAGMRARIVALIYRSSTSQAIGLALVNAAAQQSYAIIGQNDSNLVTYRANATSSAALGATGGNVPNAVGWFIMTLDLTVGGTGQNNLIGGNVMSYAPHPAADNTYDLTAGSWFIGGLADVVGHLGAANVFTGAV